MSTHQEQNCVSPLVTDAVVAEKVLSESDGGRRAFLAKCGKFAVVTSPAVTLLLDTSMAAAHAKVSGKPPHAGRRRRRRRRPQIIIKNNYYFYPPRRRRDP